LAPALVATALLASCAAPDLDREQAAEERRTCASLRERVAARALDTAGFLDGSGGEPDKGDGLSPLTLLADPGAWYATLDAALAHAAFGPGDGPSPVSPASRLVERCRRLEP
jgi:hypothetical protein